MPIQSLRSAIGTLAHRLMRQRAPEPPPIVLHTRRVYVLPTGMGLTFIGALGVMLLASINYTLSLGFGMLSLLAGAGVVSIFHAFRTLRGLSISPGKCAPVFAGEPAVFTLRLDNADGARRPGISVSSASAKQFIDLAPNSLSEVRLPRPTHGRGWLPIGTVIIETRYPLGLIRAWSVLVPTCQCLVYPAPEQHPPPLPPPRAGNASTGGELAAEEEYVGLRDFRASDSLRHVAWKIVAREGPLMVKQFQSPAAGDLALDWAQLPVDLDHEARIARLTAWVLAAHREAIAFSLHLPDASIPRAAGDQHLQNCLTHLALCGRPHD